MKILQLLLQLNPHLSYFDTKAKVDFKGSCLKQDKIAYYQRKVVTNYIVYERSKNFNINSYPTLENLLFSAFRLTKNDNIDKYKHSVYGIGFDRYVFFSHPSGRTGRNVIIFGVDTRSSTKVHNKKKKF